MKKFILDLTVNSVEALSDKHVLIKLTDDKPLPEMFPGQFVEIRVAIHLRHSSVVLFLSTTSITMPMNCGCS